MLGLKPVWLTLWLFRRSHENVILNDKYNEYRGALTIERLLDIKHGYNFRDLGGYQTTDGHTTKWQRTVRSAALNQLNRADLATLSAYGVHTILDFRTNQELLRAPDRVPGGAKDYHNPILAIDDTRSSATREELREDLSEPGYGHRQMIQTYHEMIADDFSQQAYRNFFDYLIANQKGTLLFHCTAGKDRTGLGAIMFLAALGVPQTTVLQDYLLTNEVSKAVLDANMDRLDGEGASAAVKDNIRALWTVHEDYFTAAMDEVKTQAGDLPHYLSDNLQLSDEKIAELRRLYLA
ncbi:tyrosine-protein phosphatase [Furfurilactobacillus curtus]|uniref:tyrosine-protein phosphatase n=1 Tax=Furfurilactobacillus curtus TaxID=1746200 RepID=UPI0038B3C809